MKATATVESTGEVIEFDTSNQAKMVEAWKTASDYIKAYEAIKDAIKPLVPDMVNDKGISEPFNGYMFRVTVTQRKNYDKAVLREVFDEDTLDLFLQPDKTAVDRYLKEHLEDLGEGSTLVRKAMIPVGNPYQTIRLEKV